MLKTESSTPDWVPEGYRKLGWHAGFDVLIGPMYFSRDDEGNFKQQYTNVINVKCIKTL